RDRDAIPKRYAQVKEEMEASLLDASGGEAPERSDVEALRARYDEALRVWTEGGRTDQVARELNERRSEYERSLTQLELAVLVQGPVAGNGELETWRAAHQEAEQAYVEIE